MFVLVVAVLVSCNSKKENKPTQVTNAEQEEKTSFYVGTYTNVTSIEEGGSQGIYKYAIDKDGKLSKIGLAAVSNNPSFLAKTADNRYLVATNETSGSSDNGTVVSYEIDGDTLNKKSISDSGGAHPCHVSINKEGDILVSNYTGGNVGLLKISKNGTLSDVLDVQQHEGNGTHQRQDAPHAHSSWFRPDGKGVISVDLGTNELISSEIEGHTFVKEKTSKLQMKAEAGPRHIAFHPNGKYLYVLNELDNTVGLVSISESGALRMGKAVSMLPKGYTDFNKGADIHVSNDGRFVYASNRGHNSIAIFEVDMKDGSLMLLATESTKGDSPRNFTLALDDNYVLVANQKSNNIVSFSRDKKTGLLSYVDVIDAPAPVCLLF